MDGLNDQTRVLADVSRRLDSLGLEWMLTGALVQATRSRIHRILGRPARPADHMAHRHEVREIADTSPEMLRRWRALLAARSGEERLRMATGMFEMAKELVRASLAAGTSERTFRRHLVHRLYPQWAEDDLPSALRLENDNPTRPGGVR